MQRSATLSHVDTSHGRVAVEDSREDSGTGGTPVVLLHGNSSSREIFEHQRHSPFARGRRLIAVDFPGHGASGDAHDPLRTYTRSGLADVITELFAIMRIGEAIVVGWSLGGHVGIDLLSRFAGLKGLMITGTPPVRPGAMAEGFHASAQLGFAGRPDLSDEDVSAFARAMVGDPVPPFLPAAIRRTDKRFRDVLFKAARAGAGGDQRDAVETSKVPIAVVNGAADPLVNLDYFDRIAYGNLWDGHCHRLPGAGHAPFWQQPAAFNAVLGRFLDSVA
ncbi:alpha/beta fold hydrolase [Acuticoccus yangtzensis]|uniref:alpha/beta fold hydrolase n=1 Tax=Acuticoccus yangtzensis TaxID=1443441 RepID=UPI0009496B77|nr:alpha/beta hydrolase [Acuticoccus yangtzensis]